jgi:hypothetical protein
MSIAVPMSSERNSWPTEYVIATCLFIESCRLTCARRYGSYSQLSGRMHARAVDLHMRAAAIFLGVGTSAQGAGTDVQVVEDDGERDRV